LLLLLPLPLLAASEACPLAAETPDPAAPPLASGTDLGSMLDVELSVAHLSPCASRTAAAARSAVVQSNGSANQLAPAGEATKEGTCTRNQSIDARYTYHFLWFIWQERLLASREAFVRRGSKRSSRGSEFVARPLLLLLTKHDALCGHRAQPSRRHARCGPACCRCDWTPCCRAHLLDRPARLCGHPGRSGAACGQEVSGENRPRAANDCCCCALNWPLRILPPVLCASVQSARNLRALRGWLRLRSLIASPFIVLAASVLLCSGTPRCSSMSRSARPNRVASHSNSPPT
jgi:hypothetical protein